MATFDLVVLSSSPPPASSALGRFDVTPPSERRGRAKMASYSPAEVSPLCSPQKRSTGALKSGSRVAAAPEGAMMGFATAGSLVRERKLGLQLDVDGDGLEQAPRELRGNSIDGGNKEVKKPTKRPVTANKPVEGKTEQPKQRKPRARKPKRDTSDDAPSRATAAQKTYSYFELPAAEHSRVPSEPPLVALEAPAAAKAKVKVTKARKPRVKKDKTEGDETQTKIKKARVTRPRAAKPPKNADAALQQQKNTGKVSLHFATADLVAQDHLALDVPLSPQQKQGTAQKEIAEHEGLELQEAVPRRREWTPSKDTAKTIALTDSASKENDLPQDAFTNLLSNFTCGHLETHPPQRARPPQAAPVTRADSGASSGATKRRRAELVDIPGNKSASRDRSPEKGKAPKKKARTITDLVTGQYVPAAPVATPLVTSQFFSPRTKTTKVPLKSAAPATAEGASKKTSRKRANSKASEKSDTKSAKGSTKKNASKVVAKPKYIVNKLLSPASAMSRLDKQDLLFGTSSQLAREESPTLLREIQQAIKESEREAEASGIGLLTHGSTRHSRLQRGLAHVRGHRSLWSVSARDKDDGLLKKEDVYMPEPDRTQDFPLLMDGAADCSDSGFVDIETFPSSQKASSAPQEDVVEVLSSDLGLLSSPYLAKAEPQATGNASVVSSFEDISDYPSVVPARSKQDKDSSFLDIDDYVPSAQLPSEIPTPPKQPSASAPADTSSTDQPKKQSGKPLLKNSALSISQPARTSMSKPKKGPAVSASAPLIVESPPTTPRKNKSGRFANIEEILDTEDDEALSPSPPRTKRLQDSPPLTLQPFTEFQSVPASVSIELHKISSDFLRWEGIKSSIFSQISDTIRAIPPTNDLSNPSWHEKILMYDPIVLEDFTAFLNRQTSIRTYRRATQKQMKEYSKHLKKIGDSHTKIEELGEDMVWAVEKEMEAWMVQGWCQETSICCISKEKQGGGARKGLY